MLRVHLEYAQPSCRRIIMCYTSEDVQVKSVKYCQTGCAFRLQADGITIGIFIARFGLEFSKHWRLP